MEAVYFGVKALLVFLLVCSKGINGETSPDTANDYPTLDADGTNYDKRQYLWFGPRLGKRSPGDDDQFKDLRIEDSIADLIKDSPWALIPLRGSERNMLNFTPRLGRNNDEDTMEASRSPPFSPRLGRRRHVVLPFSPRLGRTYSPQGSH